MSAVATPAAPAPADPAAAAPTPTPAATPAAPAEPAVAATPATPAPTPTPGPTPAPAAPEYRITRADTALLSEEDAAFVIGEAKALGLTPVQAQQLFDSRNAATVALAANLEAEAKKDPEIGGAQWDKTKTDAVAGLRHLFKDESELALVTGWFDRTGLGNHKLFLRAMARIGRSIGEDRPNSGGGTNTDTTLKPTEEVLFKSSYKPKG